MMKKLLGLFLLAASVSTLRTSQIEQVLKLAQKAVEQGQIEQARAILLDALTQEELPAGGYALLGAIEFQQGRREAAIEWFQKALSKDASNLLALKGLGVSLASLERYKQAEVPLRRACELTSTDFDSCYYLGRVLYFQGRFSEAIEVFERVERHGMTNDARLLVALAKAYEGLRDYGKAQQLLAEAVRLVEAGRPVREFSPHAEYARLLILQGRHQEAVRFLQAAIEHGYGSHAELLWLGRAMVETGKLEEAEAILRKVLALKPDDGQACLLLGNTLVRLGKPGEARRYLERARNLILHSEHGSFTLK